MDVYLLWLVYREEGQLTKRLLNVFSDKRFALEYAYSLYSWNTARNERAVVERLTDGLASEKNYYTVIGDVGDLSKLIIKNSSECGCDEGYQVHCIEPVHVYGTDGEYCMWREDGGKWVSECGHSMPVVEGTHRDEGFKVCPYCGNDIIKLEVYE